MDFKLANIVYIQKKKKSKKRSVKLIPGKVFIGKSDMTRLERLRARKLRRDILARGDHLKKRKLVKLEESEDESEDDRDEDRVQQAYKIPDTRYCPQCKSKNKRMFVDKHSGDIACKDCGIVVKERKRKRNKTRLPPIKNDYKLRHKSRTLSLEEMNDLQDFVGKLSRKSHRKKSPKKKSDKKKNKRLLSAKKLQAWYRNLSPKKKKKVKLQPFTYKDSHNQRYYVDAKGNVEKIEDLRGHGVDSDPRSRAQVFADVFGSARTRRPKKKKKSAKKKKKSAKKKSVKLSARQKFLKREKKFICSKETSIMAS